MPLKKILLSLEQRFSVSFSYLDADIDGLSSYAPDSFLTLQQSIEFLEQRNGLRFTIIDKKYVSITKAALQTYLCGQILDAGDNLPVKNALIQYRGQLETMTDANGFFYIDASTEPRSLEIKNPGSLTSTLSTRDLGPKPYCTIIYLIPKTEVLSEVIVSAYLTPGLIKTSNGDLVVKTKEFGILPGLTQPDVLHAAQALPGVESIDETISNINIRGGTHDQNLILWDGIKMYQSGHFFGLISAFNPYLNEKVTVTKNGTSALYGDGVSGVINMQSYNDFVRPSFGIGADLINLDAFAEVPVNEKLRVQGAFRRSTTDLFTTPTYQQFFDRVFQDTRITNFNNEEIQELVESDEDFYFFDFSTRLQYDLSSKDKFNVNFLYLTNQLDYRETLEEEGFSDTKNSFLKQQNLAFGGAWEHTWNSKWSSNLNAYYTNYNLESVNRALLIDQELNQKNEVSEKGIKWVFNHTPSPENTINYGYQFFETAVLSGKKIDIPAFTSARQDVIINHSVFTDYQRLFNNKKTLLSIGLRFNYIPKLSRFLAEPRLNVNHKLTEYLSAKVQSEQKSQFISQIIDLQEDFLGVERRQWVLSNDINIPVITSNQTSFGLDYNKNNLTVSVEWFYKFVDGVTAPQQGFLDQNQFSRSIGNYRVNGVEFLINKKTNRFSTWLSYTFNNNDYDFGGIVPPTFPNNVDIRHSVKFGNTLTIKNLKLALGALWRKGRPFTVPEPGNEINIGIVENTINFALPNNERLDDYIRLDFSANYNHRISNGIRGNFGISVLNLLDRRNILNSYYRLKDVQGTEIQRIDNLSLGITPNISFRVFF